MSVLIKGMEMPSGCRECPLCQYYPTVGETRCRRTGEVMAYGFGVLKFSGRSEHCPLVELPEKHGCLIDADALLKEFEFARKSADMDGREYANAFRSAGGEISTEWWAVEDMVENAAVVVEAEGEEQ